MDRLPTICRDIEFLEILADRNALDAQQADHHLRPLGAGGLHALKSKQHGEAGWPLFPKNGRGAIRTTIPSRRKPSGERSIRAAKLAPSTIYWLAEQAGWKGKTRPDRGRQNR